MTIPRLKIWSAAGAIACAALCALTILAALWLEWSDPRVWKTVATFGILFFLAAIVYAIVNGLDRKSN